MEIEQVKIFEFSANWDTKHEFIVAKTIKDAVDIILQILPNWKYDAINIISEEAHAKI